MTSDNKQPAKATAYRRPLDPEERFARRVTLAFIALTVAVVAVIVIGVAYGYWDQHLKPVASVAGTGISRDQWTDRARLEAFRLERQDRRITQSMASGELTAEEGAARRETIQQAQQDIDSSSIESLIDLTFQGQLASAQGVAVTEADVEAAITADASKPESRQIGLITIEPKADANGDVSATARQAALTAANQAVADLAAGKSFEQVARTYSTDASKDKGGDHGTVFRDDTTLDPALLGAIFAAREGDLTPLISGLDGEHSIARVKHINPATPDPSYEKDLRAAMSWDAYRGNIRMETIAAALNTRITADATAGDKPQLHLAEIWLSGDTAAEADSGKVRASHILFSPEDDPSAARAGSTGDVGIPPTDPSWTVAQSEAGLAFQRLDAIPDVAERQAAFAAAAKAHSDDTGSGSQGGDLGYFDRTAMVPEFADALFDHLDTLKPGDVIGPVKSDFGYHVIMFQDYQPPLADRLEALKTDLAKPGADFAAIAKASSDGAQAGTGGDLGWLAQAQVPADALTTISALAAGAVSEPVELEDGWHVYRLIERADRPLDPAQVASVRATAFDDWYTPQRDAAESSGTISRDDAFSLGDTSGG